MTVPKKHSVSLLVTDVDNTLFDWLAMWHTAFSGMMAEIVRISGIPQSELEPEVRRIHQRHGSVEYSFLIEEMPSLIAPGMTVKEVRARYDPAVEVYRSARLALLKPYPGVIDTLEAVRKRGCRIVAYTESLRYHTTERFKQLGFDGLIDYFYSPGDFALPSDRADLPARRAEAQASLAYTIHRTTPPGEMKPNPRLLLDLIRETGGDPARTVYVGDSLQKDVWMAQEAGILDAFAAYGSPSSRPEYDLLRRVSHWTDEAINAERTRTVKPEAPAIVLEHSFSEILNHCEFEETTA